MCTKILLTIPTSFLHLLCIPWPQRKEGWGKVGVLVTGVTYTDIFF